MRRENERTPAVDDHHPHFFSFFSFSIETKQTERKTQIPPSIQHKVSLNKKNKQNGQSENLKERESCVCVKSPSPPPKKKKKSVGNQWN